MSSWKILIDIDSIFKIFRKNRRIFGMFGPTFSEKKKNFRFPQFWYFQKYYLPKVFRFFDYLEYPGVSKYKQHWCWESWKRPPSPKIIKMMTCWVYPKLILKVSSSKWSRMILRSFCAILLMKFIIKMPPPAPNPLDPKSTIFPDFPGSFQISPILIFYPNLNKRLTILKPWLARRRFSLIFYKSC